MEKEYLVFAGEMKEYDKNTIEYFGMPSMVLMERAALAAAEEIEARFPGGGRVLVAAGSGNNGGDGIAVGRILRLRGFSVDFFLAGERGKCSKETEAQIQIIEKYGCPLQNKMKEKEYDIIVDALFGIGLSRELEGSFADAVRRINESGAFICSIDIPYGQRPGNGRGGERGSDGDFWVEKTGSCSLSGACLCGRDCLPGYRDHTGKFFRKDAESIYLYRGCKRWNALPERGRQ